MSASDPRPPRTPHAPEPPVVTLADLDEARALVAQLGLPGPDEAPDPDAWLFEPAVQQLIGDLVEEEVARWAELLPPEGLDAVRLELLAAYHGDPVTIEYLRRIRPRPDQDRSGKRSTSVFSRPNVVAFPVKKAGGDKP